MLSSDQWAYLAGFMDGEACLAVRSRNKPHLALRLQVHITQKFGGVLRELHREFGVGSVYTVNNKGGNIQTRWSITATSEVVWLLQGVIPALRLKKPQADLLLEAGLGFPNEARRKEIEKEVSRLKTVEVIEA